MDANSIDAFRDRLTRIGYLDDEQPVRRREAAGETDHQLTAARERFCYARRLSVDADDETVRAALDRSFCPVSFVEQRPEAWRPTNRPDSERDTSVVYAFSGEIPEEARGAIGRAFGTWAQYAPLTFVEGEATTAQVLVVWASADSKLDGKIRAYVAPIIPFKDLVSKDGPQTTSIVFDATENWSTSGLDLETIALHEIGHVLGLTHYGGPGSIMNADLDGVTRRDLAPVDIDALRKRHGSKEPLRTVPGKQKTRRQTPQNDPFDPISFCGLLEPGDVLLFEGLDPFASLLQWIDGSAFNHAALWVGDAARLRELESDAAAKLASEAEKLVAEGVEDGYWTLHAGLSKTWPRAGRSYDEGAITLVSFLDLVDPPAIGMTGSDTRTVLARHLVDDPEGAHGRVVLKRAAEVAGGAPVFDYQHLVELCDAWIGRSYPSNREMRNAWDLMSPQFIAMRDQIEDEARKRLARKLRTNKLNKGGQIHEDELQAETERILAGLSRTTCARLVFDAYSGISAARGPAARGQRVIEALPDRDLSDVPSTPSELRNMRMWVTPGDLQMSPSLEDRAVLLVRPAR